MGTKSLIRDNRGWPVAEWDDCGDEIWLLKMSGEPLGKYIKSQDITTNPCGVPINMQGNCLGMLIPPSS